MFIWICRDRFACDRCLSSTGDIHEYLTFMAGRKPFVSCIICFQLPDYSEAHSFDYSNFCRGVLRATWRSFSLFQCCLNESPTKMVSPLRACLAALASRWCCFVLSDRDPGLAFLIKLAASKVYNCIVLSRTLSRRNNTNYFIFEWTMYSKKFRCKDWNKGFHLGINIKIERIGFLCKKNGNQYSQYSFYIHYNCQKAILLKSTFFQRILIWLPGKVK